MTTLPTEVLSARPVTRIPLSMKDGSVESMPDTDVAVRVAPLYCAPCGRRRPHKTMFLGAVLWIKCMGCWFIYWRRV